MDPALVIPVCLSTLFVYGIPLPVRGLFMNVFSNAPLNDIVRLLDG